MSTAVKLAVAIWEASAKAVLRVMVSPSSRAGARRAARLGVARCGNRIRRQRLRGSSLRLLRRIRTIASSAVRLAVSDHRAAAAESASRTHHG